MENSRFLELREQATKARFEMCDRKAVGYTEGNDDRLWNFKAIARETGSTPMRVLGVYLLKHIHSMNHYIASGAESGDGIQQTIADIQNYLDLLGAMVVEQSYDIDTPGDVGYAEREKEASREYDT